MKWKAIVQNRTRKKGCPFCSGGQYCECNSLYGLRKELMQEWSYEKNKGLDPKGVAPSSGEKVWWTCSYCKKNWQAIVRARVVGGIMKGCGECVRKAECSQGEKKVNEILHALSSGVLNGFSLSYQREMTFPDL